MFFVLSKILAIFIYPLIWTIVLLVMCILAKSPKRKRIYAIAACAILWLFSNEFVLFNFAKWWQPAPVTLPANSNYSCAIVLGGFVESDVNGGFFNNSCDRFIQAELLYKQHIVSHILITGGNGNLLYHSAFRESDWAKGELMKCGIPDSAILTENRSRNTLENGIYTKQMLDSLTLKPPYILVTSAYHMPRSLMVFRSEKVPVIAYPCDYISGRGILDAFSLLPNAENLSIWSSYIKEVIGYWAYALQLKRLNK